MRALATSALLVVAVLAAAVIWFALNPDPMGGEPSVTVAIEASGKGIEAGPDGQEPPDQADAEIVEPQAEPQDAPQATANTPAIPPQDETTTTAPPAAVGEAPPAEIAPPTATPVAPDAGASPPKPPEPVAPPSVAPLSNDLRESKVAALRPPEAPNTPDPLVEESRFGPLPRIAPDGRRPADVYSRPTEAGATAKLGAPARIAILINGLGLSESVTGRAVESLPGAVTLGFGPYGRNLQDWVAKARGAGHEVMLQIPLEPYDYPDNDPGPHTLLTKLSTDENVQRLRWLMSRFTGYVGVTNNMGAKFVTSDESFLPVLEEIKGRGLVYLDDGAAAKSAAGQVATGIGLPFSVAEVQLDAVPVADEVARALASLEAIAKERGLAIGVGSARPMTIDQIDKWTDQLAGKGIMLIPITAAIRVQHQS